MGQVVYLAPKLRAIDASRLACPERARKLAPSIPHPRSDLAPVLKAVFGLAAVVFGLAIGGGWAALASGYQGGLF